MFIPKAKYDELVELIEFLKIEVKCDEEVRDRLNYEIAAYRDVINQFLYEDKLTCEDYEELHRRQRIAAEKLIEYHNSIQGKES